MSYILERFGTVTLPFLNPDGDAGTGPSVDSLVGAPGGWFDALGSEQAPRAKTTITKKATLKEATAVGLQTTFAALRALRGKRDRLYRRQPDGTVEWCTARLMQIEARKVYRQKNILIDVTLTFLLIDSIWHGQHHSDGWTLDSGEIIDLGLYLDETDGVFTLVDGVNTISVTNGGNAAVRNAVLTFTYVGASRLQSALVEIVGVSSIQWNPGALVAGLVLEIDCGALSVLYDNSNAYNNFTLETGHVIEDWLVLEPGANEVKVTIDVGVGGTEIELVVDYRDGWE